MLHRFLLFLAILGLARPLVADDAAPPAFELLDGDRVVFLGNTLIERMQRYGYVEAALTARWPDRDITFRNLGWSGDTVWAESRGLFDTPEKGYERLLAHVGELKPTVIVLGYGNNESFAGEAGLPAFVKQYEKLLDDLTKVSAEGVRFVMLSPVPMESVAPPGVDVAAYNARLAEYGSAVRELAERRAARYVDMASYVLSVNAFHADGAIAGQVRPLTFDGLQFTEFGHRQIAADLGVRLGLHNGDDLVVLHFDENGRLVTRHGGEIRNVERADDVLRFELRADPLTPEWLVTVEGAADDSLALRIGNETYAADWGLSGSGTFSFPDHPDAKQYGALRQAIVEKNRLYFHRWRPQNVTYLTLFRKHEQGQNAKDALEFDRLVAEKEREIAKLRKPVTRTYELIRVESDEK